MTTSRTLRHNNNAQILCISRPSRLYTPTLSLSILLILSLLLTPTTTAMTTGGEVDLGTTLVALKFDFIVGADTRTSVSGYVSNKLAQKIFKITSPEVDDDGEEESSPQEEEDLSCVICRSGSAADTQWLCQEVTHDLWERKYRYCQTTTVRQVAHFLRHLIRQQGEGLQASLICAGCDEEGKIFAIAPSGTLLEEDVFAVSGSGSTVLLGHLDSLKISRDELYSEKEAVALVTKLLRLSIGRDGSSGGLIRLVVMKKGKKLREITVYPDAPASTTKSTFNIPGFAAPKSV
eukprot:CAMPEP_0113633560 /NCGR_PEP_ID=MMETSP0017_2-20120614/17467_1 /TAXON_ID=2856 /ORGANISM="Cylindrotheca closterium" /LENGTH=290 /DNA_ID=CAMNT_0000544207 /DNA_START=169 /DNA_END=1041 /DNA_ORIENTATION=- /assembly_acc=CAM_ASM_000147